MKNQDKLRNTGQWPSLEVAGAEQAVTAYERKDGLKMLHFADPGSTSSPSSISRLDSTRVVFRLFPDGALLLGLSTAARHRGKGVGPKLVSYFMEHVGANESTEFLGTGLIHKPGIALCLGKAGLKPHSEAYQVEILPVPSSAGPRLHPPKVQVVRNELDESAVIRESPGGKLYETVDPEEVIRKYPINSPDMTVAIHTRYGLPAQSQ